ncbi:DUF6011 domain-containing protein [Alkalihalobacillus sp. NPDC078783]
MNHREMRLIDTLIATKVNGWTNITKSGKVSAANWYKPSGDVTYSMRKYQPTVSVAQAIAAANNVGSFNLGNVPGASCQVTIQPYAKISTGFIATGEGETVALALCQAMLAAFSLMTEDYQSADDLLEKDVVPQRGDIYPMCNLCGRPLKSKASQIKGYGPVCFEKQKDEREKAEPNDLDLVDILHRDQQSSNFMDELEAQKC